MKGQRIGYVRVSTLEQNTELREKMLRAGLPI